MGHLLLALGCQLSRLKIKSQSSSGIEHSNFGYWQEKSVELTELLCTNKAANQASADPEYFVPFPNIVYAQGARIWVHTVGYANAHLRAAIAGGKLILDMYVIRLSRKGAAQATDQLAGAVEGSSIKCCFLVHQDSFLVRAAAIASVVQRVPINYIPSISTTEKLRIQCKVQSAAGDEQYAYYLQIARSHESPPWPHAHACQSAPSYCDYYEGGS